MKKIILLLTIFTMVFTSCDPLEDINTEIDAQDNAIIGDIAITLTDDDYSDLGLSHTNFSSIDGAKTMIPDLLVDKYPAWGDKSSATVTFNIYNKVNTYSKNIYALSDDEHNAITGNTYGNFDRDYHIFNYLDEKYSDPSEGDFHSLRYRFYSGGETTLTDGFAFENGDWTQIKGFTPDEYNAMGESYPNFSSHDEAAVKIPVTLLDVYKFNPKEAGDIVQTMYELYKGGGITKSYTSNYIFDGTSFAKYNNVIQETIQFGHDGNVWVPDNTIKYTLTRSGYSDYDYIAEQLDGVAGYEGLLGNLSNYDDFDYNWSNAQIIHSLSILAAHINPTAEEGQKYTFTYVVYDNGENERTSNLILTGGEWVSN